MGNVLDFIARGIVLLIAVGLTGFLGGCATTAEPQIRTVEVKVPVRVACVPKDVPPAPTSYADENSSHMTPEERYLAIARANQERRARLTRLEPVVELCRQ